MDRMSPRKNGTKARPNNAQNTDPSELKNPNIYCKLVVKSIVGAVAVTVCAAAGKAKIPNATKASTTLTNPFLAFISFLPPLID